MASKACGLNQNKLAASVLMKIHTGQKMAAKAKPPQVPFQALFDGQEAV